MVLLGLGAGQPLKLIPFSVLGAYFAWLYLRFWRDNGDGTRRVPRCVPLWRGLPALLHVLRWTGFWPDALHAGALCERPLPATGARGVSDGVAG